MANRAEPAAAQLVQGVQAVDAGLAFLVGRDPSGRCVAVETRGRGGGYFKDIDAALHYAAFETGHRPATVRLVRRPLCLRF